MQSTKTYSEQRQAILFRAARDLRGVASQVLDDVREDAELTGSTVVWAKQQAARTAKLANDLEGRGHEETVGTTRAENDLSRSRQKYSEAIDDFEARIAAATRAAGTPDTGEVAYIDPTGSVAAAQEAVYWEARRQNMNLNDKQVGDLLRVAAPHMKGRTP